MNGDYQHDIKKRMNKKYVPIFLISDSFFCSKLGKNWYLVFIGIMS